MKQTTQVKRENSLETALAENLAINSVRPNRRENERSGPLDESSIDFSKQMNIQSQRASDEKNTFLSSPRSSIENMDKMARNTGIDSRDKRYFKVSSRNFANRTMEAFAANTKCNASRFPETYKIDGLARGKVELPPPKSSLAKRRATYDAYSERAIEEYQLAQNVKFKHDKKMRYRNKKFDMTFNHIFGQIDELAQNSVDSEAQTGFEKNRSLNVSPQSYIQLLGHMNQMKYAYNVRGDRTEPSATDVPSEEIEGHTHGYM